MKRITRKSLLVFTLAAAGWISNGEIGSVLNGSLVATAEAVVGRPATPVSYAGVARRSTVGAGAPGVGVTPGVGVGAPGPGVAPGVGGVGGPASGVGVLPGAGAGQAGVGYSGGVGVNLGGPVNRVGPR
jgi:hypothetical protein